MYHNFLSLTKQQQIYTAYIDSLDIDTYPLSQQYRNNESIVFMFDNM